MDLLIAIVITVAIDIVCVAILHLAGQELITPVAILIGVLSALAARGIISSWS